MPAVTADTLTLPRIVDPTAAGAVIRPVHRIIDAPSGHEGEGFPVRRAFAGVPDSELDPFIHMDQMGEVNYAPYEPRGTDWHPHRGFETVTYIIDGTFLHQDSHGGGGSISNGATQWMTAGRGILHIETPPESLVITGGLFHGLQLWVNLPASMKMSEPRYQNLEPEDVVLATTHDAGALLRIIAGDIDGYQGPGGTHTPITVAHLTIEAGHEVRLRGIRRITRSLTRFQGPERSVPKVCRCTPDASQCLRVATLCNSRRHLMNRSTSTFSAVNQYVSRLQNTAHSS